MLAKLAIEFVRNGERDPELLRQQIQRHRPTKAPLSWRMHGPTNPQTHVS